VLRDAEEVARRASADAAALSPGRLPAGWSVVKDRPMRAVLRAVLEGDAKDVHVKVRRSATPLDRARDRWRAPRGPTEGELLEALIERGVPAARPVAWSGDAETRLDVLVTLTVPAARSLAEVLEGPIDPASRRLAVEEVARLLRRAHDAGWRGRDLHRDNVLLAAGGPVLLDPGDVALGPSLAPHRRAFALGVAAHGLGVDARTGLRALRAYFDDDRAAARRWAPLAASAARSIARAYRRGRSRRATRSGLHFEVWRPLGPTSTAIRSRDRAPAAWVERAAGWVESDPPGLVPMKAEGNVTAGVLPDLERVVVLKRWPALWRDRFRVPRPIRAFRRAYALRVRGVACPEPLLAVADGKGRGVYVAALAGGAGPEALDLHRACSGGARSAFASLPAAARRDALHRLGRFLRRLHDAETSHRDLKAPNLVAISGARGAGVAFAVVDLDGARVHRGPVPWQRRARDVARLDASLSSAAVSRADRMRVLRGYFSAFERLPVDLATFARKVSRASGAKRRATRSAG
jgi:tRNA A-37 threonylcarbamoyl transferase component Bud32